MDNHIVFQLLADRQRSLSTAVAKVFLAPQGKPEQWFPTYGFLKPVFNVHNYARKRVCVYTLARALIMLA